LGDLYADPLIGSVTLELGSSAQVFKNIVRAIVAILEVVFARFVG
jgi:hypothetical protein